jgi:ribosomal protein S18 acetylase RimI-like enzyme
MPADADAFLALRREALAREPLAFSASPEQDRALELPFLLERLRDVAENAILGAFDPMLVGATGLRRDAGDKARHKTHVWGMYVQPAARRRGIGAALLSAAIAFARGLSGVGQIQLSVAETADPALRLYQRHGFRIWGTEPDALHYAGRSVAVHHLVLSLPKP